MDTEKCRVLLRAVQLGSMSQTSTELGYTPSGVSYIIDTVEKELGFKVISRTQTGITLTHAGIKCIPFLEAMVDADDAMQRVAKQIRKDIGGEITVGTFPSIGRLILPDIMHEYMQSHPNVVINIAEGVNEQLEQMMLRKEVDFCICSAHIPGYDWIPLRRDYMVCIMSKENPLSKKTAVTAEDMKNEKFIMTAYGRDTDLSEMLKRIKFEPNVISYTFENSSAYEMIRRNMGITIVNELGTVAMTDDLEVRQIDPPQYIVEGILIKSLQGAPPAVREFIKFIEPYIKDEQDINTAKDIKQKRPDTL